MKKLFIILSLCFLVQSSYSAQNVDMMSYAKSLKYYGCKVSGDGIFGAPSYTSTFEYFPAKSAKEAASLTISRLGIRRSNNDLVYDIPNDGGAVVVSEFVCFEK